MKFLHSTLRYKLTIAIAIFGLGLMIRLLAIPYQISEKVHLPVMPTGGVRLIPERSTYHVGDTIVINLENDYPTVIHLKSHCPEHPLHIYLSEVDGWQPVNSLPRNTECTADQGNLVISPNGRTDISFSNWPELFKTPGKYRVVATLDQYDALAYCELQLLP